MPDDRAFRDLASLTVPSTGSLTTTGDPFEPYRLLDPQGETVSGVADYLRDVHACGRPATTVRSYAIASCNSFAATSVGGVTRDEIGPELNIYPPPMVAIRQSW